MSTYTTLGALEQAQDDAARAARARIEQAEEYVGGYRSQVYRMQENFYEVATRHGVSDDPGFRDELRRVSDRCDENVRAAAKVIDRFEEDLAAMTTQHRQERENFLQQRQDGTDSRRR